MVAGTDRTCLNAAVALQTPGLAENDLRLSGNALRVVAPGAAQRAAFEEDCRSDAGPVFDAESLHVENDAGRFRSFKDLYPSLSDARSLTAQGLV